MANRMLDLTGQKSGRLTAIRRTDKRRHVDITGSVNVIAEPRSWSRDGNLNADLLKAADA